MSEPCSSEPVTGFARWQSAAVAVLSTVAITLLGLALWVWPQVSEEADLRRTLQEEGTEMKATVRELSFTRTDATALGAWARARGGTVYYVDLSDSSLRVTRPGEVIDIVVQADFSPALPPDVVDRPAWTAYLQGRLLWPLAGIVVAVVVLFAVVTR